MRIPAVPRRPAAVVAAGLFAVVLLLLVFLGPGSFRVWASQREQTRSLNTRITALDRANAQLADRAARLRDPAAIRELARSDYGMVPKGSQAFAILPSPHVDTRPSGTWPFVTLSEERTPASDPGN